MNELSGFFGFNVTDEDAIAEFQNTIPGMKNET